MSPGVSVIADYNEPVFYSGNYYWRYYNNNWYRSPYWNRGWSYATPPYAIRNIHSPYAYRNYRPYGYTAHRGYYNNYNRNYNYNRNVNRNYYNDNRNYHDHQNRNYYNRQYDRGVTRKTYENRHPTTTNRNYSRPTTPQPHDRGRG